MVVGGDHGDTAFQFGASVSVHFRDDAEPINFELSVCELICRKDTAKLIEATILERLTGGLKIVSMWHLHIERNEEGQILERRGSDIMCVQRKSGTKFSPCRSVCDQRLGVPSDGAWKRIDGRMVMHAV